MNINIYKELLNGSSMDFQKALRHKLEEALVNHPRIQAEAKIVRIYEQINKLNAQIKELINEAKLAEAEGAECFDNYPDSVGIDPSNDNVTGASVEDMSDLIKPEVDGGLENQISQNNMPQIHGINDVTVKDDAYGIFSSNALDKSDDSYNPYTDDLNITANAKVSDYTSGLTHGDENQIGIDPTNDNVQDVKVVQ